MAEPTAVLAVELTAQPEKLLAGFKRADDATGAYAQAAQRHMQTVQATFNGVEFSTVTNKAKAESLKLIELEHQLTIARVSGEKATAAGLQEEIALLQKVRQLRSAGLTGGDATAAAKASLAAVAEVREAAEAREAAMKRAERIRGNPAEALEGVFSRSRLGVLEEGGAKIPLFGSSLEALGAAGVVAAGGLFLVSEAAEKVRQAMEYAEDVEKTSKALGISATELQKYDDAAIATGIGQDKFRESIRSFNEVFGNFASGLAKGRTVSAFKGLGFTPESARDIGSVSEALDKAIEAIAKIQNPQQRAALASRFGLTELLPLLAEGQEGIEKFKAAQESFAQSGALISPEQIARAAELNDKVEELEHRIGQEFKAAFIDAAPAIETVAEFIERCTRAAAGLVSQLPDAARGLVDLLNKVRPAFDLAQKVISFVNPVGAAATQAGVKTAGPDRTRLLQHLAFAPVAGIFAAGVGVNALAERGRVAKLRGALDGSPEETARSLQEARAREEALHPHSAAALNLAGAPKEKSARRGPVDTTDSFDSTAKQASDAAQQDLAQATAALIRGTQAHAQAEADAVDAATRKRIDALNADEVKIRKASNDARSVQQLKLIEEAKTDIENAAKAKKELIQRTARETIAEQAYQSAVTIAAADLGVLDAGQALAHTRLAQAKLAAQILQAEQKAADDRLEHDRDAEKKANPADADRIDAKYDRLQTDSDATFRERRGANRQAYESPGQKRVSELQTQADGLGDQLEGVGVKGLDSLADGFVDVATGAKTAQAAVANAVKGIVADLIRLAVQQEIELPLARALFGTGALGAGSSSIGAGGVTVTAGAVSSGLFGSLFKAISLPGHASGADSFGGLTKLNEQGPEGVAYLPHGTQIIPNDTLRGLAKIDPASLGGGSTLVTHQISIDLTGANGDAAIAAAAHAAAYQGAQTAIAHTNARFDRAAKAQRNRLG